MPAKSRYNRGFESGSSMAAASVLLAGQGLALDPAKYDKATGVPKNPKAKPKGKDRYSGT